MTKANQPDSAPHLMRRPPKALKKGGLHTIAESSPLNAQQRAFTTAQPAERERAFNEKMRAMPAPTFMPVRNSTMRGAPYACPELQTCPREAAPATALPSRVGKRLFYPDGRVTDLAGNPLTE